MTAPVFDPHRSTSTSPAPVPAPRRRPQPQAAPSTGESRPQLRVLRPEEAAEADRRKLVRLVAGTGVAVAALCLFAVVVFHVVLTQNQFRLDALQDQALERQAEYDRLRLEVAQLESPDRIVADAQVRLGMVPAPSITYLTPAVEDTPGGTPPAADDHPSAESGTSWSVVKPHLADG